MLAIEVTTPADMRSLHRQGLRQFRHRPLLLVQKQPENGIVDGRELMGRYQLRCTLGQGIHQSAHISTEI